MRILMANPNRQVVGGAESYLRSLIPALRSSGHHVSLVYEREPAAGADTLDAAAGEVECWRAGPREAEDLLAHVAAWRPAVAFIHGLTSPDLERVLVGAVPSVLFAHGYYGTCATGTKRHAWLTPVPCQRRLGVACLALHYPRRCGGLNPSAALASYRTQRARLNLLSRYHGVCVASRHMREEYVRHGVPATQIHVTPLPPAGITRDAQLGAGAHGSGRLLFVGRATDLKLAPGVADAVSLAARQLGRHLSLEILGEGPAVPGVVARARRLGVNLSVHPWAPPARRNELFRASELLVVPSTWPEPWGLVGLEAACVGLPSVAYAVGGIPEWLIPGHTGELAPATPPGVHGLTQAMVRALSDAAHYQRLRRGAWEHSAQYTMDRHVSALLPVLESAAASARAGAAT